MNTFGDLYEAIEQGNTLVVGKLLTGSPELVSGDGENPPPLHWAIYHDETNVVELLLTHGASITQRDPDRNATALEYAVVYGREKAIRLLIANGASPHDGLIVAAKGASGGFKAFDELPTPVEYQRIVQLLSEEV